MRISDWSSDVCSSDLDGPAGKFLEAHGVAKADFNSFGSRRGNHEIMMRGTFANTRIKNAMTPGVEGGVSKYIGKDGKAGDVEPIYDVAMKHQADKDRKSTRLNSSH